jgi:hypothetical protein
MEAQEDSRRHFQLMAKLAGDLGTIAARILAHEYRHDAFGSWWMTVQRRGDIFRIVFDGKERELRLERATESGQAESWEDLGSWSAGDRDSEHLLPEVVSRLRGV